MAFSRTITVAFTGASGMPYGLRLLECLLQAGAQVQLLHSPVLLPPAPGFYARPRTIDDLVDFVVARVLDHLQVAHDLLPRWGSLPGDAGPASGSA